MNEHIKEHPSYGILGFYRRHGGMTPLFGSSIQHNDTIAMVLKHGKSDRSLNKDWYYGKGTICEVEMSYSQFAELISSMNMGDGVPVTITYTEKDGRIEPCSFVSKRDQFENEFSLHLNNIKEETSNVISEISEMFQTKSSIGKSDRAEIIRKLQRIQTQINSNTEFIYSQFNEQMEKTVTEAKGEIEAFCQNKIHSIAQAALVENRDEFLNLGNPVDLETHIE